MRFAPSGPSSVSTRFTKLTRSLGVMETLSERRFELLADETLNRMVDALADQDDEGMDADLESGVLTIEFADGSKYVINSHRAARQIWMAAGTTAWHFDWNGTAWISSKTADELWGTVQSRVGAKLGRPLEDWPSPDAER